MANYMLSIKRANGFEELMWNKVEGFENLNVHNLEDLDKFTTSFENEEKMKLALLMSGVMKPSDASKSLTIKYKNRGSYKTLMYGPAYKEDKKFFDEAYLASYIKSKRRDIIFLEKLCNHYRNSHVQGGNVAYLRNYINYMRCNALPEDEHLFDRIISDFVIRECFSYDSSTYTYKVDKNGNPVFKYKSLHDLGMFVANYERTLLKQKEAEKEKEKIKVIGPRWEQLNIFDMKKTD